MERRITTRRARILVPLALVTMLGAAPPAMAQSAPGGSGGGEHGHFFFYSALVRPASAERAFVPPFLPSQRTVWHFGGGGEAAVGRRFGIGSDVGGIRHANAAGTVGVVSVNAFYHPLGQHRAWLDPYATAGVSALFYDPDQRAARPNVGAGVNCWLPARRYDLGLGVEVRDASAGTQGSGFLEVRFQIRLWQ